LFIIKKFQKGQGAPVFVEGGRVCHGTMASPRLANADKLARRVQRSVNVTKHGTIWYIRYMVSCSNFVPKTHRTVCEIFDL